MTVYFVIEVHKKRGRGIVHNLGVFDDLETAARASYEFSTTDCVVVREFGLNSLGTGTIVIDREGSSVQWIGGFMRRPQNLDVVLNLLEMDPMGFQDFE